MVESDYGTFSRAFGRVCGAFRVKLKPSEGVELTRTYFRVLEAYSLDEVLRAGKQCLRKYRRFPPPVEWIAELTPVVIASAPGADRREMGAAELDAYERAVRLRYVDAPCGCIDCDRAGVTDRPLRFVPTVCDGIEDRAINPRRHALDVAGHWAHGDELGRWYAARDRFFAAGVRYPRVLRLLTRDREPGEEG